MLSFYKLVPEAVLPYRAHPDDAGLDLISVESLELNPSESALIPTGLKVQMPKGHYGQICSRSGLSLKKGLIVHQGVGIIDAGYDGELKVIMRNVGSKSQVIEKGDRIAQFILCSYNPVEPELAELWSQASDRGQAGFGSSGLGSK
jgi:dUTP pyrophosphatase